MNSCNSRYLVCIFQLTLSQGWRGTPRREARCEWVNPWPCQPLEGPTNGLEKRDVT